jgi:hypothetical protein
VRALGRFRVLRWWGAALAGTALAGCHAVLEPAATAGIDGLLRPAETSPGSVTLEILHLRAGPEKAEAARALWQSVDEQGLGTTARRRLVANGFRAGVVGGPLPGELADLLGIAESDASAATVPEEERLITDANAAPRVRRRLVQLDRREHASIQASEMRNELNVLIGREGRLHGRSYRQAQAVYTLKAAPTAGRRAGLSLVPEVHHGELRNRYQGSEQGIFLMTPSREREVFDDLMLQAELSPGEWLVLGCFPEAGASLGQAFHGIGESAAAEQKLLLVRLLQVPQSEILATRP